MVLSLLMDAPMVVHSFGMAVINRVGEWPLAYIWWLQPPMMEVKVLYAK
jgi:hypothetical protein